MSEESKTVPEEIDWRAMSRKWERRAKDSEKTIEELTARERSWRRRAQDAADQRDTNRADAERWERRARENRAVIHAHELTISKFIARLNNED